MSTINDQMIAGYDYKEWVRLESLFLKDYENSTRYNKPFSALISDVLENETYKSFADKTGLSENMLYRLKKQIDEKDPPQRNSLITVCITFFTWSVKNPTCLSHFFATLKIVFEKSLIPCTFPFLLVM